MRMCLRYSTFAGLNKNKLTLSKMKKIYFGLIAFLVSVMAFSQGVTTSSIGGKVTDNTGEPLPGATVVAVHVPSGSKYGAATDFDGFYRISNMRSGGPYRITISYVGFNDYVQENVSLTLGYRIGQAFKETRPAGFAVVFRVRAVDT